MASPRDDFTWFPGYVGVNSDDDVAEFVCFFWLEFGDAFIFLCFFLSVFNLMYCLFMFVSVF